MTGIGLWVGWSYGLFCISKISHWLTNQIAKLVTHEILKSSLYSGSLRISSVNVVFWWVDQWGVHVKIHDTSPPVHQCLIKFYRSVSLHKTDYALLFDHLFMRLTTIAKLLIMILSSSPLCKQQFSWIPLRKCLSLSKIATHHSTSFRKKCTIECFE